MSDEEIEGVVQYYVDEYCTERPYVINVSCVEMGFSDNYQIMTRWHDVNPEKNWYSGGGFSFDGDKTIGFFFGDYILAEDEQA